MLRRLLLAFGAVLLVVLGGTLVAGALGLYGAFGWSGTITRDLGVVTPAAGSQAVLIDVDSVAVDSDWPLPGQASMTATAPGGSLVMVAGDAPVADQLLRGVEYSVATKQGNEWSTAAVPGQAAALDWKPLHWSAVASNAQAGLPMDPPVTVVVLADDGRALEPITLRLHWQIGEPRFAILAFGGVGLVLVLAGLALVYAASVVRFRRD